MARYRYKDLYVFCHDDPRYFRPEELRSAVEHLKRMPQRGFTSLVAHGETVDAGPFKLGPNPALRLNQIVGKTPAEVWELFDAGVDEQRKGLVQRGSGHGWTS
nr:hypothetical protein [uncultured bacterium]